MKTIFFVIVLLFADGHEEAYKVSTAAGTQEACAALANTTFTALEQKALPDLPPELQHAEAYCIGEDGLKPDAPFNGTELPSYLVVKAAE